MCLVGKICPAVAGLIDAKNKIVKANFFSKVCNLS